ncbi:MAG: hypothetical protein M3R15_20505 [Acidobacteriota bacterium]|nr:hypothetical protein [Acidobacteriota bacterium]
MIGKTVNDLHHLFDGLSGLKARAATSKQVTTRKMLKNRIVNGVNDVLSSTDGFAFGTSPGSAEPVADEKLAECRKIQRKAVELRDWALRNL